MTLWPESQTINDRAYRNFSTFTTLDSPIVALTCTPSFVYFATKKKSLLYYPTNEFQSGQPKPSKVSSMRNIVQNSVQSIGYVYSSSNKPLIYILAGKELFIRPEKEEIISFKPALFDNRPLQIQFICTLNNHSQLVVCDNNVIKVFKHDSENSFITERSINHKYKIMDIIGTNSSTFMICEKNQFIIFDHLLNIIKSNPKPSKTRFIVPVENKNTYIAVCSNNQLQCIGESLDITNMRYPDELISLHVHIPYCFGFSSRNFMVTTTVVPIQEKIEYNDRFKAPLICILEKFTVIITNNSTIHCSKFSLNSSPPYNPHLQLIQSSGQKSRWDYMLKLCNLIKLNDFNPEKTIQEIYANYSQNLFDTGKGSPETIAKAFEYFKESKQHPFVMIRKFQSLLNSPNTKGQENQFEKLSQENLFEKLAISDCQEYKRLLINLKNAIDNNLTAEEILNSKKLCIEQAMSKEEIPTIEYIKTHINEIKEWTENSIIETEKSEQEIKNILFHKMTTTANGETIFNELMKYIKENLKNEKNPTKIKIYNTLLIRCFNEVGAATRIPKFISKEKPLLFGVVSDFLLKKQFIDYHKKLCQTYGRHREALETFTVPGKEDWNQVIDYIKDSKDFMKLGEEYYPKILHSTNDPTKSVEVFNSKHLKPTDVNNIIKIITNNSSTNDSIQAQIHFLDYDIYQLHDETERVHTLLINLYLNMIKSKNEFKRSKDPNYIPISRESKELKEIRTGLVKILKYGDGKYYNSVQILEAITKVDERGLIEEKLAVLKRRLLTKEAKPQQCIDMISSPKITSEVALNFCDSVYDENNENTSSIYTELFFGYCQQRTEENKKTIDQMILRLLNEKGEMMNLQTIIESIPKSFTLQSMQSFLKAATLKHINKLRLLKIQNALLRKTIETKKKQKKSLQMGKVEVDSNNPKCIVCGKPVLGSYFVVTNDNCVAHIACHANK